MSYRLSMCVLAGLIALGWTCERAGADPVQRPSKRRRSAAIGAAIFPGVLAHGSGHFILGERAVARRLLVAEGIGFGLVAAGGVPLFVTGASRHYTAVPIAMLVSGAGVFLLSWAADVYGATGLAAPRAPPATAPVEVELGYGYVQDPRFAYRSFAVAAASIDVGPVVLAPVAWLALDDDNQRLRLEGRYAFWRGGDASRLEAVSAATHHRYPDDGFAVSTLEAGVAGRLDMARIGDSLAGSFADLSLGLGGELTNYYTPGAGADLGEILLVRFGYGVAFGCPGRVHGEASIYYDHRRDTFTGGISPGTGPGSGFMGLVGVEGLVHLGSRWGLRARFEQGAARVFNLGVLTRFGDTP